MKKNFTILLIFLLIFFSANIFESSAQIYVAPDGDDNNAGTLQQPYQTIEKALTVIQLGDTIYLRGGIYTGLVFPIGLNLNGTENNRYYLFAYQQERPVLDFSTQPVSGSYRGIMLRGSYWHIKGIDIMRAGDNGMFVSGSYNIIEFCSFYENHDTGLQLGGGASHNRIINCDSYYNSDPGQGNADGFAPKLDVGVNNYFYGCRAWQNSDDGWDGYLRGANNVSTIIEYSWCFANGYLKDGSPSNGNGNGYKMGGGDNGNSLNLAHNYTIKNSLAFDNRVKGYDQNNNRGSMTLHNNSAYRNGTNYSIPGFINAVETAEVINCVALGSTGSLNNHVVQLTNSWHPQFTVTVDDFISIDTTGARGPRQPNGLLPDIDFMKLALGSDLIDAGTDVGLPFDGSAPDLGAYEYGWVVPVELASFSASISGSDILLKWTTATEVNNLGFEVQKKFNDNEFRTISFVTGAGTITEKKEYNFIDKNVSSGIISYRLKQIDLDGTFSLSDEVQVNLILPGEFSLQQNYPNPFNPATSITFSLLEAGNVSLKVYNIIGEIAATVINNELMEPGSYKFSIDLQGLSSGTYIYVLTQGEKVLSKKMILMK
jgi:hypothetical protein